MIKRKITALLTALVLAAALAACGAGGETTLTGIVVSVDGTVISLIEMDRNGGNMNFEEGQMPSMLSGLDGFQGFGDFVPEGFDGNFPDGGSFPQWGSGEMPEMPEGMTIPDFSGGNGGMDFDFENFVSDAETKDVDIEDAHISVEIDGGKASGSLEDLTAGTFVTITMNAKGVVTNVLVSSQFRVGRGETPF